MKLRRRRQVLEDISFASRSLPTTESRAALSFTVSSSRLDASEAVLLTELKKEKVPSDEAAPLATAASHSFSGIALWPRVVLNDQLACESRGVGGAPRKSHWQTVLPLMCARPAPVGPGDRIRLDAAISLGAGVKSPPKYSLQAEISPAA